MNAKVFNFTVFAFIETLFLRINPNLWNPIIISSVNTTPELEMV